MFYDLPFVGQYRVMTHNIVQTIVNIQGHDYSIYTNAIYKLLECHPVSENQELKEKCTKFVLGADMNVSNFIQMMKNPELFYTFIDKYIESLEESADQK